MKKSEKRSVHKRVNQAIALSQISMLILEIFAFSFILGGMAVLNGGVVSAVDYYYLIQKEYYTQNGITELKGNNELIDKAILSFKDIDPQAVEALTSLKSPENPASILPAAAKPEPTNPAPAAPAADGTPAAPAVEKTAEKAGTQTITAAPTTAKDTPKVTLAQPTYDKSMTGKIEFTDYSKSETLSFTSEQIAKYDPDGTLGLTTEGNKLSLMSDKSGAISGTLNGQTLTSEQISSLKSSGLVDTSVLGSDSFTKTFMSSSSTIGDFASKELGDSVGNGWTIIGKSSAGDTSTIVIKDSATGIEKTITGSAKDKISDKASEMFSSDATAALGGKASVFGADREYSLFGSMKFTMGGWGHLAGNLLEGVAWSAAVWTVVGTLTSMGVIPEDMGSALGPALAGGILAGKAVYGVMESLASSGTLNPTGWIASHATILSAGVGIIVGYLILANKYEKTSTKTQSIEFKCMTWQAPSGGANCHKCNEDKLRPCSEYRCKSLGQTCMMLNEGTGEERCIDSSPDDTTSPGIEPWDAAITNGYEYSDVQERPPGGDDPAHMKITFNGGCLPAYTPFTFGITTTDNGDNGVKYQPAQCKVDLNHTTSFDDMAYYMGNTNLYIENHSETISLPGVQDVNSTLPEFENGGEYNLYIRCKDGNGNENRDEFLVSFCMDNSPDLTPPEIKAVSLASGSPVQYQIDNVSLEVYTNEPAKCRWSRKDTEYRIMENNMTCSNQIWEMNANYYYTCKTTLTSVVDREQNDFYFACEDMNNNTMQQNYPYTLYGTQPLDITSVGPEGIVGSSTTTAKINLTVTTDNGYNSGISTCYYSLVSNNSGFVEMYETNASSHKQPLDLTGGNYNAYFKCVDAGGNADYNQTSFFIDVDKTTPIVTRIYNYENSLYFMTNENASCRYSTINCNFDMSKLEGTAVLYDNSPDHIIEWKVDQTYYIKCKDEYGNEPDPSACSIIARPYSLPLE